MMNWSRYGEDGIRIIFGDSIDPQVSESVRRAYLFLKSSRRPEIIDIIPSFKSCLIRSGVIPECIPMEPAPLLTAFYLRNLGIPFLPSYKNSSGKFIALR